jgi:hypothetical protein
LFGVPLLASSDEHMVGDRLPGVVNANEEEQQRRRGDEEEGRASVGVGRAGRYGKGHITEFIRYGFDTPKLASALFGFVKS